MMKAVLWPVFAPISQTTLLLLVSTVLEAQPVAEKRLTASAARLEEQFTNFVAIRDLSDGTVLVAEDPRDVRLIRADFDRGTIAEVGALGDGPNEYRGIHTLITLKGDSTILVDWRRSQWMFFIGPSPIATRSTVDRTGRGRISWNLFGADSLGRVLEVRSKRVQNEMSFRARNSHGF